ncbi:MAG: hypothetical protein FJY77_00250 [Candidatus Altiarchaeales archaeon]|nr:hypothetical protein [Candidatus Altiarchaeales archaeon]
MHSLILYLLYGIFLGPAFALAYGLREFTPEVCFISLTVTYIVSVALIQILLSKLGLESRFKNKVFSKVSEMVQARGKKLAVKMDDLAYKFKKKFGDFGFYLALTSFTFVFGVYWAGLVAYLLRLDLWRAVYAIATGTLLSVGFWMYVVTKGNLNPEAVTLFFLVVTVVSIIYGSLRERYAIAEIAEKDSQRLFK